MDVKQCPMCGEEILSVAKKCKHCGEYLTDDGAAEVVHGKSRLTYILLGFFFGIFGAHNFYAGYKSDGRLKLYLLLLPILGWFISAVFSLWEICVVTKDASGVPLK